VPLSAADGPPPATDVESGSSYQALVAAIGWNSRHCGGVFESSDLIISAIDEPLASTVTDVVLSQEVESEPESMFSFDNSIADEDYDPGDLDIDESTDSQNSCQSDNETVVAESCEFIQSLYTLCLKKRSSFYFFNNSVKNETTAVTFGMRNPENTLHPCIVHLTCKV